MDKGDIVLITLAFTDLSGSKLRPALVLAETKLDVTVSFITTRTDWTESSDVFISPAYENGLKEESIIRISKVASLEKSLAKGFLGKLNPTELSEIDTKLKIFLKLS